MQSYILDANEKHYIRQTMSASITITFSQGYVNSVYDIIAPKNMSPDCTKQKHRLTLNWGLSWGYRINWHSQQWNLHISPWRRSSDAITFSSVDTTTRLRPLFWVWNTAPFTFPMYCWCLHWKRNLENSI